LGKKVEDIKAKISISTVFLVKPNPPSTKNWQYQNALDVFSKPYIYTKRPYLRHLIEILFYAVLLPIYYAYGLLFLVDIIPTQSPIMRAGAPTRGAPTQLLTPPQTVLMRWRAYGATSLLI
jgi:hypothetical protein